MDTKQLEYILMIAQEQNITHAAKKLYITRSALNYSLLNLEKELGLSLFTRLPNKLIPTYAGKLYLEKARHILTSCHELSHQMKDLADSTRGTVNLGVTFNSGQQVFMEIFPLFHEKYPNFTVHLVDGNVKNLEAALVNGEIDLAWNCNITKNPALDYIPIREQTGLVLAVPNKHPLLDQYHLREKAGTNIDLSLFKDEYFILMNKDTFIWDITKKLFEQAGFRPKTMVRCRRMDMAIHFACKGIGPAFIPSGIEHIHRYVTTFSTQASATFQNTILFRRGTRFTEAEKYLIQLIREHPYQAETYNN